MDYLIYYYCTDENQYKKYLFSLVSLLNFIFKLFLLTVSIFLVEQAKDSIIPKIFLLSLLINMKKALWAKTSSDSAFFATIKTQNRNVSLKSLFKIIPFGFNYSNSSSYCVKFINKFTNELKILLTNSSCH